ncbi:MAG: hypothetical protein ACRD6X_22415, partial [Pyrinomonadaceae bacterium]
MADMILSYKFEFSYAAAGGKQSYAPEITAFSVNGGASRSINADSDSLNIGSEFEQARTYKNIVLFMPGSPGANDMRVAMDLMNFANNKTSFFFIFIVTQLYQSKLVYLLSISDGGAKVAKPPMMTLGDLL